MSESVASTAELLRLSVVYARAVETDVTNWPILSYVPSPKQLAAHQDNRKIVVVSGSNRSGKSFWLSKEIVWAIQGDHPYKPKYKAPFKIYLVGPTYKKLYEQVVPEILRCFPKGHPLQPYLDAELDVLFFPNGCTIHILSNESKLSAFASGDPVIVAYDEEPSWRVHQECVVRCKQLLIGCTSIPEEKESNVWLYQKMLRNIPDLRTSQTGGSDQDIGAYIMSMYDNPTNSIEYIEFRKRQLDPAEVPARIYGDPTPMARRPVFLPGAIARMEKNVCAPQWTGDLHYSPPEEVFSTEPNVPQLYENPHGELRLWRMPNPMTPYIIGGDVAGGKSEEGDFSVGSIFDPTTFAEVAQYRSNRVDPITFGDILAGLGWFYNCALIACEAMGEGHGTIERLRATHAYPNLYVDQDMVKLDAPDSGAFGYVQNPRTKARIIGALKSSIRYGILQVYSDVTWRELRIFTRKPNAQVGGYGAPAGDNDDTVIALGIAHYIATSMPPEIVPWRKPTKPDSDRGMLSSLIDSHAQRGQIHPVLGRILPYSRR